MCSTLGTSNHHQPSSALVLRNSTPLGHSATPENDCAVQPTLRTPDFRKCHMYSQFATIIPLLATVIKWLSGSTNSFRETNIFLTLDRP